MGKILFTEKALPWLMEALNIKTDISLNQIAGFKKVGNETKIIKNDLLSIMEFVDGDVAQLV